jgi:hypothetical protein
MPYLSTTESGDFRDFCGGLIGQHELRCLPTYGRFTQLGQVSMPHRKGSDDHL